MFNICQFWANSISSWDALYYPKAEIGTNKCRQLNPIRLRALRRPSLHALAIPAPPPIDRNATFSFLLTGAMGPKGTNLRHPRTWNGICQTLQCVPKTNTQLLLDLPKHNKLQIDCIALPCLALPSRACLALPSRAIRHHAVPCHPMPCYTMPCLVLPCLALTGDPNTQ